MLAFERDLRMKKLPDASTRTRGLDLGAGISGPRCDVTKLVTVPPWPLQTSRKHRSTITLTRFMPLQVCTLLFLSDGD
jgi:hypothetical protein